MCFWLVLQKLGGTASKSCWFRSDNASVVQVLVASLANGDLAVIRCSEKDMWEDALDGMQSLAQDDSEELRMEGQILPVLWSEDLGSLHIRFANHPAQSSKCTGLV